MSVQSTDQNFKWVSCKGAQDNPDKYVVMQLDLQKTIESWAMSIVAHEWLKSGIFKLHADLQDHLQEEWTTMLESVQTTKTFVRPILGIGVLDNVEVGTNRAVLSVAKHLELVSIEVVVPKPMADLFEEFQI